MIIFCEECGRQHEIRCPQNSGSEALLACDGCEETLKVPDAPAPVAAPAETPIRLMIVDDSRLIRKVVRQMFDADERFQVVGEAANGREALDMLAAIVPDVITLDIKMPEMDGLSTLKHIMIKRPTPTIMISALTRDGATETFDALRLGAIDFMPKPSQRDNASLEDQERLIKHKVKLAAGVKMDNVRLLRTRPRNGGVLAKAIERCVVLGASEGGYGALLKIIPQLDPTWPAAYLAVLYAAEAHLDAFVDYLDANSALRVRRAADGTPLEAGTCYLASGSEYVTAVRDGDRTSLRVHPSPFPERRGAINMLMLSVSEVMAARTVAVVLTGKDVDGAEGAAEIARVGGEVLIQDPRTCLFKEMALSALRLCRSGRPLNDSEIATAIKTLFINQHHRLGGKTHA
ncbi:MAG: chemotaxis protein CheB [Desulfobacterales bacterium]|nr:chemotaxis protein CheB [Desulfobacterales bacterium]